MVESIKSIKNTSQFPSEWAEAVTQWIASRFNLVNATVVIRHTSRGGHGHASWNRNRAVCSIERRKFRRNWSYSTMAHDKKYVAETALESFVFLMAHELCHLSAEGRRWKVQAKARGGHWRQSMEFQTQCRAWETVLAYREERRSFLKLYRSRLARRRKSVKQVTAVKAQKNTPEWRLSQAEKRRDEWAEKLKQANRYFKKWNAKANRTRSAIAVRDRKAATTSEPSSR